MQERRWSEHANGRFVVLVETVQGMLSTNFELPDGFVVYYKNVVTAFKRCEDTYLAHVMSGDRVIELIFIGKENTLPELPAGDHQLVACVVGPASQKNAWFQRENRALIESEHTPKNTGPVSNDKEAEIRDQKDMLGRALGLERFTFGSAI